MRRMMVLVLVGVLLLGTVLGNGCGGEEDCQLQGRSDTIHAGSFVQSQQIDAIAASTLDIGLVMQQCSDQKRIDTDCTMDVMILTPDQLLQYAASHNSIAGLDLDEGLTYYENAIDLNDDGDDFFNTSVYFGEDISVQVVFVTNSGKEISPLQYALIDYDINYVAPGACADYLAAVVFTIVGLILVLIIGKIVYVVFGKKMIVRNIGINSDTVITDEVVQDSMQDDFSDDILIEDAANMSQDARERNYHKMKKLAEEKSHKHWILRPALPHSVRKPCLPFVSRPVYSFDRYWLYNHHWASLCFTGPNPKLSRFSKLFLVLTLLMIRMFMVLIINEARYSTTDVIASNEFSTVGNIFVRYVPLILLVYLIEYFLGELYEKILVWKQRAEQRFIDTGEGFGWRFRNPSDSKGIKFANTVMKFLVEIVLGIITFCVIIGTLVLLSDISCEVFWQFIVGLILVEFFKVIFPGIVFIWLIYLIINTWGAGPKLQNPWNEDEDEDVEDFDEPGSWDVDDAET